MSYQSMVKLAAALIKTMFGQAGAFDEKRGVCAGKEKRKRMRKTCDNQRYQMFAFIILLTYILK